MTVNGVYDYNNIRKYDLLKGFCLQKINYDIEHSKSPSFGKQFNDEAIALVIYVIVPKLPLGALS